MHLPTDSRNKPGFWYSRDMSKLEEKTNVLITQGWNPGMGLGRQRWPRFCEDWQAEGVGHTRHRSLHRTFQAPGQAGGS